MTRTLSRSALVERVRATSAAASTPVRLARWAALVVIVVIAIIVPQLYGGNEYILSLATECIVYALITISLNLLVGYGGQISLGHAGLVAIGGYAGAYILEKVPSLPFPAELAFAALVTTLAGVILGLPTGRLRGHYLAVVTLGLGVAIPQIALNLTSITNGRTGLIVNPPSIGSLSLASPVAVYYLSFVVTALSIIAIASFLRTRSGRAFTAVRDSEQAAAAMGINVQRTKVVLFAVSAFFAGVGGDLFGHWANLVAPGAFPFTLSLFFLAAVIVGGSASLTGSVIGAVLLVLADTQTTGLPGFEPVVVGAVVIAVLLLVPGGLVAVPRAVAALKRGDRDDPRPTGGATARHPKQEG
ncbi:MAG: branched-chain amino acid ABC transporter permease [Marmoricola sp.]